MSIKYGNFDTLSEQVNDIVNLNALLILLSKKNLITNKEFLDAKDQATEDFKKQFPELFNSNG
ncbi:hypothetical protein C0Q44_16060 [Paenibacillus sp. PCH8]|uniref:hypothetical protein n=1 Tax=Paenibacillus sp. PCH8 TaxID=2066524 RepID=UPI000CF9D59E|nr:hypothetical protein [Paenibacillus sp. PCH8]PQP82884.1 hypothetical protein C0Q44_16060 [Paenibacillus sp. PCH8]